MGFCPKCGAEYEGSPKFCGSCGSSISSPASVPPEASPVDYGANPAPAAQPSVTPTPAPLSYSTSQPDYSGASYTSQNAGGQAYSAEKSSSGILGLAWNDVKSSPDLVPRVLLLSLIGCVPVLSFVSTGYALRWGRRAAFRTGDSLPSDMFADNTFLIGFYSFVITLVLGIVVGILNLIPFVGWIASLLMPVPLALAGMHVAMLKDLGAGFRISDMWEKAKSDFGGLLGICYVPALIACVVMFVVLIVASMLGGISFMGLVAAGSDGMNAAAGGMGLFGMLIVLIACYVCVVALTVASLVEYRAMGYWVARFAPDWVQESVQTGQAPL